MSRVQRDAIVAAYALVLEQLGEHFREIDADQRLRVSLLARNFANDCSGTIAALEQEAKREQERIARDRGKLKGTAGE